MNLVNRGTVADDLQHYLQHSRDAVVASLDGLSEHDVRRPLTSSGTNLLGVLKHLTGVEDAYLGSCVGRPSGRVLPWWEDGSVWENGDMWAQPEETRAWVTDLYRTAWAHSDATIAALPLDAPAYVEWWGPQTRETTLGELLVRTVDDTARHAGHADVLREVVLGRSARDPAMGGEAWWDAYVDRVQSAADAHG